MTTETETETVTFVPMVVLVDGTVLEGDVQTIPGDAERDLYDGILNEHWTQFGMVISGDSVVVLREQIQFVRLRRQ